MPSILRLNAPAKVNLFLNLLGVREDGFHEVRFVMQTLDWMDVLDISLDASASGLSFRCSELALETSDNLVVKAYELFYEHTGMAPLPMTVRLEKNVPVAAGLGGGSSDAAAMLRALQRLHENPLPKAELLALAANLGSDVPFFLVGGTAIALGRGEKVQSVPPLPPLQGVLLKPLNLGISTPEAYGWMRDADSYQERDFSAWEALLVKPSSEVTFDVLAPLLANDFEAVLLPRYPILAEALARLNAIGLTSAIISGSGPTLFALISDTKEQWPKIQSAFPKEAWFCQLCRFLPSSSGA